MRKKIIIIVLLLVLLMLSCANDISARDSVIVYEAKGQYSKAEKSLPLQGDDGMVGGGIIVYVRNISEEILQEGLSSQRQVPMWYEEGKACFETLAGQRYMAYLEFFIDGLNNTEIDGQALSVDFIATGEDEISFYVTSQGAGLFVNGISHESNLFYSLVGINTKGNNPEERAAWRKENYELYGGDGFVAEFLVQ